MELLCMEERKGGGNRNLGFEFKKKGGKIQIEIYALLRLNCSSPCSIP